jgi:hypothetical protein
MLQKGQYIYRYWDLSVHIIWINLHRIERDDPITLLWRFQIWQHINKYKKKNKKRDRTLIDKEKTSENFEQQQHMDKDILHQLLLLLVHGRGWGNSQSGACNLAQGQSDGAGSHQPLTQFFAHFGLRDACQMAASSVQLVVGYQIQSKFFHLLVVCHNM